MTGAWHPAVCVSVRDETPSARSIRLRIDGVGSVIAGTHIDVRLTADDGYQAVRSYSLSATPAAGPFGRPLAPDEVEITVEELDGGEVSPYLVEGLEKGDELEVRGPIGGFFIWSPPLPGAAVSPVLLIGGGSGVAPLMAMLRARIASGGVTPFRLVYSVRSPETFYFRDELAAAAGAPGITVDALYTRQAPPGSGRPAGRIGAADLETGPQDPDAPLSIYVCGPNAFVASVTDLLIARGHAPASIRTERFGGP